MVCRASPRASPAPPSASTSSQEFARECKVNSDMDRSSSRCGGTGIRTACVNEKFSNFLADLGRLLLTQAEPNILGNVTRHCKSRFFFLLSNRRRSTAAHPRVSLRNRLRIYTSVLVRTSPFTCKIGHIPRIYARAWGRGRR